jgi:hypothetical protein
MRRPRAWLLFIVAIVFSLVLTYPYLSLDIDNSRLHMRDSMHYSVLGTHRTLGRVYLLAGVLPSALATIPVAVWSGRLLTQIGLTTAAVLWLITGGLAYRAARRRDFTGHRAWMMRNYALTFLAVTSRILVPVLLLVQIPFGGADAGSIGERAPSMIPIGQTLGWIINLIVVEGLIRRAAAHRTPGRDRIVML